MNDLWQTLAFLAVWFAIQRWLLPAAGVST